MITVPNELAVDPVFNMARQSLYRFAALALLDPRAGSWERLNRMRTDPLLGEASALVRGAVEAFPGELGPGERPTSDLDPAPVLARLPAKPQAHNLAFENLFGLLVAGACPLYETEYIDSKFAFQRSNALADISGFYRAFGLAVSKQHPERPDHIVLELEFMAYLLGLERVASGASRLAVDEDGLRDEKLQICRDGQRRFFEEHLAWWVPAMTKLLIHEGRQGFYGAVGVFLAALIPAERALLNVPIPFQHPVASIIERPDQCEGCQIAFG